MRVLKVGILSCAVLLSVIGGGASNAATIQNFDSGWYTNNGFTAGVTNINVGSSNLSGAVYHNLACLQRHGFGRREHHIGDAHVLRWKWK